MPTVASPHPIGNRTIYLDKPDASIRRICQAAFPEYRGRSYRVAIRDRLQFFGTQWSGGTRSRYVIVRLSDPPRRASVPEAPFLQRSAVHDCPHTLPRGFVVVEHTIFCGRDHGLTVHTCAGNIDHLLPDPGPSLSRDEQIVLCATRSLKSSYGGIRNFRFHEANRETGITPDRWESAKAALIDLRLLNRAGAVTPAGRNAIGNMELRQFQPASPTVA